MNVHGKVFHHIIPENEIIDVPHVPQMARKVVPRGINRNRWYACLAGAQYRPSIARLKPRSSRKHKCRTIFSDILLKHGVTGNELPLNPEKEAWFDEAARKKTHDCPKCQPSLVASEAIAPNNGRIIVEYPDELVSENAVKKRPELASRFLKGAVGNMFIFVIFLRGLSLKLS